MNVLYCLTCSPKKVLAAGPADLPIEHYDGATLHTDTGKADISITRNAGEASTAFHARIEANHQTDMV